MSSMQFTKRDSLQKRKAPCESRGVVKTIQAFSGGQDEGPRNSKPLDALTYLFVCLSGA